MFDFEKLSVYNKAKDYNKTVTRFLQERKYGLGRIYFTALGTRR